MQTDTTADHLASALWRLAGQAPDALAQLSFSHLARQLPSQFQVGALASAVIGAQALAAAEFWRLRGGGRQSIAVDQRHALAIFRSERYLLIDGKPPADPWSPIAGYYQAGDGRWIQLHTNFPHHRDGVLQVLQCADNRAAVAAAIAGWQAAELDARLAQEGMCAALIRSPEEWLAHPQATAIAGLPLFELERIADSAPEMPRPGQRPLSGVRVLDLW